MPSNSYRGWRIVRARSHDEIAGAHAAVGGTARGRRYATQQINRAYAVLIAAEFQGYCRDLHTECVYHLLGVVAPPSTMRNLLRAELVRGRQLDRGNAQPSSLGADFGRLEIDFWTALRDHDPNSTRWRADLESLNDWRNAIAHQDFTSARLGGIIQLRLEKVRQWRASCQRLARSIDEVMHQHLLGLTKTPPW